MAGIVLFLALTLLVMLTKRPGCDEAWFAGPAWNLDTRGYMGTPALEPANVWANGRNMTGIDRHTYWIMPLHPLVQAAWYRIVPFSLLSLRVLSMLWALVALAAWFLILRRISTDEVVPYLGTALIALDYVFIRGASHGRMDMMGASLTFSALAAYLCLRERHLVLALMASHALAAAAMLTHPNGILAVATLVLAALIFDRSRLRVWHVALWPCRTWWASARGDSTSSRPPTFFVSNSWEMPPGGSCC